MRSAALTVVECNEIVSVPDDGDSRRGIGNSLHTDTGRTGCTATEHAP